MREKSILNSSLSICCLVLLSAPGAALAQSSEDRIKELETRLLMLEQRLAAAERKERAAARPGPATRNTVDNAAASAAPAATTATTRAGPAERSDNPEFSIVRENVATLSARSFEFSTGLAYTKNNSLIQNDRTISAFAAGRFGILDGVELGFNVPYYYGYRYSQIGPTETVSNRAASLGDATIQLTALVSKETPVLPAVNVSVGALLPTGARPYYLGPGYTVGGNPIDPLFGRQSRGEWGAFANLQFVKTYDPIVLFFGVGVEHAFSSSVQGYTIEWPLRYTYNAGLSFVVSSTSTLGFALIGSYQGDLRVNGARARTSQSEPIVARFSLSQRLAPDIYIEPSIGIGMSNDAPNVNAAMALRKRF